MEIQDGFIVGIFNYCDRWCEACAFTSRCRAFATEAQIEAQMDPSMRELTEAPPLPRNEPDRPSWFSQLIQQVTRAAANGELPEIEPTRVPCDHAAIEERAHQYALTVHAWLKQHRDRHRTRSADDPIAVIAWYGFLIPAKISRAIHGLAEHGRDSDGYPKDHEGSAKIALLAIERSHVSWLELVRRGDVSMSNAAGFLSDLVWLGSELERVVPHARAFIRPGFDEPDEVARLNASTV